MSTFHMCLGSWHRSIYVPEVNEKGEPNTMARAWMRTWRIHGESRMREIMIWMNCLRGLTKSVEWDKINGCKRYKGGIKMKNKIITVLAILAMICVIMFIQFGPLGFIMLSAVGAKVEEYSDVAEYSRFMGENADEEYRNKWDMDESIFPAAITEDMNVQDYKMVYYNPWDAQYLSYLVVQYDEAQYETETARLREYASTDYEGIYGATGFDAKYELLAMYADDYQGFVYALTDKQDTIIYVELIFCNYFFDLNYKKYIKEEYLPVGFDATSGNPYEEKIRAEKDDSLF